MKLQFPEVPNMRACWIVILSATSLLSASAAPRPREAVTVSSIESTANNVVSWNRKEDIAGQSGNISPLVLPDNAIGFTPRNRRAGALAQLAAQLTQSASTTVARPAVLTGYVSCAGTPIPGATLLAEHLRTGQLYATVSDEHGRYVIPIAAAGSYAVRAELAGFAGDTRYVDIPEGVNNARLDLTFRIAASHVLSSSQAVPPGTSNERRSSPPSPGTTSASGQLARQSGPELIPGNPSEVILVSREPVHARKPDNSGVLSLGGKRGRLLHGSFSYKAGNSALDARPYALRDAETASPDYASHSLSFSLGGPIAFSRAAARNSRTSFSIAYSGSKTDSAFSELAVVPTERERNGDFSATAITSGVNAGRPVQILDPLTGQPFAQSRIPGERISPVASALLQYIPLPNLAGPGQNYYRVGNNQFSSSGFSLGVMRLPSSVDHKGENASGKHRFAWQLAYRSGESELLNVFPQLGGTNENSGWNTSLSHTFTKGAFSSSLRLEASRSRIDVRSHIAENVAAGLDIAGVSHDPFDTGIPAVALSHYRGLAGISPRLRTDRNYGVSENMTWTNGQHTLHWGGGFRRTGFDNRSSDNAQGAFVFTGYATAATPDGLIIPGAGWDLADFLLGLPQRATVQYFPGMFSFAANSWHAFVNHDWRIADQLSLNLGLRYEYVSPYHEAQERLANLDAARGFIEVAPVIAGQVGPFTGYFPSTIVLTNAKNLAPRIGLAWRIANGTVLRGSYGVHYNAELYPQLARQLAEQPPFAVSQTALASGEHVLKLVDALSAGSADSVRNTFATKRDLRQGYAQVWFLELERELRGLALSLSYTGTKGTHLDMLRAPNRTPTGLRWDNVAPFLWQSDEGSSILHAGSVRLEKSFGMGLSFSSSYMFSRMIDNLPTAGGVPQDERNLRAERALSDFDERHRLELSYSYQLPLGKGKPWLQRGIGAMLLGNWSWTGTLRATSGSPITPVVWGDFADVGRGTYGSLRPNLTGAPIQLPHATGYLNPAAFAAPEPGQYGSASRNIITGPGMLVVDMAAKKVFSFEGGNALELSIEATNALNQPQWANIDAGVNSPSFGLVTAVMPMRRVQLTARYNF